MQDVLACRKGGFFPSSLNLLRLETSIVSPEKSIFLDIPAVNGLKNVGIVGSKMLYAYNVSYEHRHV